MDPVLAIALLWLGFTVTHVGLASVRLRPMLVERLGQGAYLGLYSLVALAFFVPLVWLYAENRHVGEALWYVPRGPAFRIAVHALVALGFVLVVASQWTPSPASVVPGSTEVRGALRITRHPLVMGIALWALAHLAANGSPSDVAFFGGFLVFAAIGAAHQDRRKLAQAIPGFREFVAKTSFFPFARLDAWRGFAELPPLLLVVAGGLFVLVRWYHSSWLGGNP